MSTHTSHGNGHDSSTVSVLTTDLDPYQELPDVSFRNILVMVAIAALMMPKKLHLPVDQIEEMLFRGLSQEWPRSHITKNAMPLYIYSLVEKNLAKLLGDPSALLPAAMFGSVRADFGERSLWVFNLLRRVTQFFAPIIATPAFYFQRILPAVSLLYNRNKVTEVLEANWRRARVRYTRAWYKGKILRRPQSDVFSMLWWMPGFTAGVVTFWYKEGARIIHELVELDIMDVFLAAADFIAEERLPRNLGDELVFDGQRIAVRVKLYAQQTRGGERCYSTTEHQLSTDPTDFRYGWRVIRDVQVTTRTGQVWTILKANENYCAQAGCSIVVYDYEPVSGWRRAIAPVVAVVTAVFTPFHWLLSHVVGWCVAQLDARALRDWEDGKTQETEAALEAFGREHFASQEEMEAALRGEIEEINLRECVVLRFDFEGHTARRKAMGMRALRKILRPFWQALFDFDVNPLVKRGKLPRTLHFGDVVIRFGNHTGDGGYVFVYNAPLMVLVQIAVILAQHLHEASERVWEGSKWPVLPLRITITHGEVDLVANGRLRNPNDPTDTRRVQVRFFAEGTPLDNCARLDVVAKQLRLQARTSGQDAARMVLMPKDLFGCAEHDVYGYEDMSVIDVRDMGEVHLVRVVDEASRSVDWSKTNAARNAPD